MAGFFNPNQALDPNSPEQFDYESQRRQIAAKQALAQQLSAPGQQGQMVSGWYVAPGKGAAISDSIRNALGNYLQVKNGQDATALDKQDRAEAMNQYQAYVNGPTAERKAEIEAQVAEQAPATVFNQPNAAVTGPFLPNASVKQGGQPMLPVGVDANSGPTIDMGAVEDVANKRAGLFEIARKAEQDKALMGLAGTRAGRGFADKIMEAKMTTALSGPAKAERQVVKGGDGVETVYERKADGTWGKILEGTARPDYKPQELAIEQAKLEEEKRKNTATFGATQAQRAATAADKAKDDSRSDDKILLDINTKLGSAQDVYTTQQNLLNTVATAKAAVTKYNGSGGIFGKVRAQAGLAVGEDDANNAQNATNAVAAAYVKSLGANPTDSDLRFAQQLSGGFGNSKDAALKALDAVEARGRSQAATAKKQMDEYEAQQKRYKPGAMSAPPSAGGLRNPGLWEK